MPSGDLRPVLPLIETLLNLRRLGSSSRQSLTLEVPSKATQYKFFSLYRFHQSQEGGFPRFERTVNEMIRVLKIALALWGLGDNDDDNEGAEPECLCTDKMMERISKWRKMTRSLKRESSELLQDHFSLLTRQVGLDDDLSTALGSGTQEPMVRVGDSRMKLLQIADQLARRKKY